MNTRKKETRIKGSGFILSSSESPGQFLEPENFILSIKMPKRTLFPVTPFKPLMKDVLSLKASSPSPAVDMEGVCFGSGLFL